MVIAAACHAAEPAAKWQPLPDLPDRIGVAGSFAGVSGGALLVGGGANFPEAPPWEGGQKVWHDAVYVLEQPDGNWVLAGKLPRPLGYGVSVTHGSSVVCVGGSDARQHFAEAFKLVWAAGKLIVEELPSLPVPMANGCGALVGDVLYVAGGQEKPDSTEALRSVYQLDLASSEPKWIAIEPCPGSGRILATAAACDGAFWVIGGAELYADTQDNAQRRYLQDAYRFSPERGWQRTADLLRSVVGAPSPALCDRTGLVILGGDDGSQVHLTPAQHKGFNRQMLRYDLKTRAWHIADTSPVGHVTAPCVLWNDRGVIISGEIRPGIRSPEVWSVTWPMRSTHR